MTTQRGSCDYFGLAEASRPTAPQSSSPKTVGTGGSANRKSSASRSSMLKFFRRMVPYPPAPVASPPVSIMTSFPTLGNGQIGEIGEAGRAEIDRVLPVGEADDRIVAVVGAEHERVIAVIAPVAIVRIVARAAVERVIASAADDHVVARAAVERVVALLAPQFVVARAAVKRVVSLVPANFILAGTTMDRVVAGGSINAEYEIAGIQIVGIEVLEADRAPPCIDDGIRSVLGDGQILESGNAVVGAAPQQLEVDLVFAGDEVLDRVVPVCVAETFVDTVGEAESEGVLAGAAVECIVAGHGEEIVVAVTAVERVVAGAVCNIVVASTAVERVVAIAAANQIVTGAAVNRIVAIATVKEVLAGAAVERVVAPVAVEGVRAVAAPKRVVARIPVRS